MTTANTDLIRVDKSAIATALSAFAPTTADDLLPIVQGNTVMFVKNENVRGGSSTSIASLVQIEYKKGSDLVGSNLAIVTTSVWNKCLVFKSGMLLPSSLFSTTFVPLLATITFSITVETDEDVIVVGIK